MDGDYMLAIGLALTDAAALAVVELNRRLSPLDRRRMVYWTNVDHIVDAFGKITITVWVLLHAVTINSLIG